MTIEERGRRERDFWGHHVPSLADCLTLFERGPDRNTAAMLDAVEPLRGARVLDFACGAGVTTAWLAQRGADVTGLDLTPEPLGRASEVLDRLQLRATLAEADVRMLDRDRSFDAVVGRYALHHTDVARIAPVLAGLVRLGGRAAFVETFASNPLLRFSRRRLIGNRAIPRLGTLDERPLDAGDVAALKAAFGSATTTVAEMSFLRMFDRQVLRYRIPRLTAVLAAVDDRLQHTPALSFLSYHQVLLLAKTTSGSTAGP